jgi:hypothetical protein
LFDFEPWTLIVSISSTNLHSVRLWFQRAVHDIDYPSTLSGCRFSFLGTDSVGFLAMGWPDSEEPVDETSCNNIKDDVSLRKVCVVSIDQQRIKEHSMTYAVYTEVSPTFRIEDSITCEELVRNSQRAKLATRGCVGVVQYTTDCTEMPG